MTALYSLEGDIVLSGYVGFSDKVTFPIGLDFRTAFVLGQHVNDCFVDGTIHTFFLSSWGYLVKQFVFNEKSH